MKLITTLLIIYMGLGSTLMYVGGDCEQTVEILKQRITVQQMTNNTQKEMIRRRDSIITVQDSLIVKLQSR